MFAATPEFLALYDLDPAVYGAYPVATQHNLDTTVRLQGFDVSYKQALTFLPPWARGLQVFANTTVQRLLGPASTNFPGFIPRTANWGVSLTRDRYILRANWNYRSNQRRNAVAAGTGIEPGTFIWWSDRLYLDVNAEYRFYRRLSFYASLRNIGNVPEDVEIFGPSTPAGARFRSRAQWGSLWVFGVKGTF